jgi:hypothetical protein
MKDNNTIKANPDDSIAEQIRDKTGFILEHEVATILERNGWHVIHNRFYLDDKQDIQREMDLLVYKYDEREGINIFTTLIVSCKKSAFKDWIFLTRDAHATKNNMDLSPFTFWTNSDILNFQLKDNKFSDLKVTDATKLAYLNSKFEYEKTVFAFREYDNKQASNKLANDTGIYDSIITLIKSQAYELDSLPLRKKDQLYYYNINLLTVADIKRFIEIECQGDDLIEKNIERINYVNRFLVNRREYNSRVVFTKFTAIDQVILDFNLLHELNCEIVATGIPRFYDADLKESSKARKIITDEFAEDLTHDLLWEVREVFEVNPKDFSDPNFYFDADNDLLEIQFFTSINIIDYLNGSEMARSIADDWLRYYFRYSRGFKFAVNELPF